MRVRAIRDRGRYQCRRPDAAQGVGAILKRFLNRRAGGMLWRNTVVSTSVFLAGLGLLWVLVELAGMDATIATGLTFILSTSVHYLFGRSWIFAGSARQVKMGVDGNIHPRIGIAW